MLKQTLKHATAKLRLRPAGRLEPVIELWSQVDWTDQTDQDLKGVAAQLEGDSVVLYANFLNGSDKDRLHAVLREFGKILFTKLSDDAKETWQKKLVTPTEAQIEALQAKLNVEADIDYETIISNMATPVDKLVAIHVFNALIKNNITAPNARYLDLRQAGPTSEFCNLERPYSIAPLTSAYAGDERVHENFHDAFASYAVDELQVMRNQAVRKELQQLIFKVCQAVH